MGKRDLEELAWKVNGIKNTCQTILDIITSSGVVLTNQHLETFNDYYDRAHTSVTILNEYKRRFEKAIENELIPRDYGNDDNEHFIREELNRLKIIEELYYIAFPLEKMGVKENSTDICINDDTQIRPELKRLYGIERKYQCYISQVTSEKITCKAAQYRTDQKEGHR